MIDEVAFALTSKVLGGVGGVYAECWRSLLSLSVAGGEACDVVPSSW